MDYQNNRISLVTLKQLCMIKFKFLNVLFLALLFYSCQYSDSDFQYNAGNDFVKDQVNVVMIDTLKVNTFTTATDSVYSSRMNRLMVGRIENKYGIKSTCESYFRYEPNGTKNLLSSSVFDSAYLIFNFDGYTFGDTTKICKLEVFRLTQDIAVDEETGYIFNTTQFSHEATPIATFSVDLTKKNLDSVAVKLPYEFGAELFNLSFNDDAIYNDYDLFKLQYKGFLIRPTEDNIACVIGFKANPDSLTSPRIEIRYHDNTIDDNLSFNYVIEKFETFVSSGNSSSYQNVNYYGCNYFVNDYSNFIVKSIPTNEGKLSSTETDHVTFLQGGLNLCTRIEIPTIDNLYHLGIGSVIKAELFFEPVKGTYINKSDLPALLELYLVNIKNQNLGQLSLVGSSEMSKAVLHYNEEFKNEIYYSFDITKFLVDEYLDKGDPQYSLLLTLPQSSINSNIGQLIIGDQNHPTNKMKLKVHLATY